MLYFDINLIRITHISLTILELLLTCNDVGTVNVPSCEQLHCWHVLTIEYGNYSIAGVFIYSCICCKIETSCYNRDILML